MANNEKAEVENKDSESKKRKRKDIFIYGNYKFYYGYRINQGLKEDSRLKVLKREWFEGKDCLDIGCNSGLVTISIAKEFCCRSILGIDIDAGRIEDAYRNLKRAVKVISASNQTSNASKFEPSERANGLNHSVAAFLGEDSEKHPGNLSPLEERNLFGRISFRKENFVESLHGHREKYDTILCLSVTKWIHLNWGDDGLITLFAKIWRLLRPGGILVLEPQHWQSYGKNYQVSWTATFNYHNIMLLPGLFQEILLEKIGFRTVETTTSRLSGSAIGFDRPIFAFHK